MSLFPDIA